MVKLKKRSEEGEVFKLHRVEESTKTEVPIKVAVLYTLLCCDCILRPAYNCMLEKGECVLEETSSIDMIKITPKDGQPITVRFGSFESLTSFCHAMRFQPGRAPSPSSQSSETTSPKSTSPESDDSISQLSISN